MTTDSNNRISFLCCGCGYSMSAVVSEIGGRKKCPDCETENSVPLPKIKVGGGLRSVRPIGAPPEPEVPAPVAKIVATPPAVPSESSSSAPAGEPPAPDAEPPPVATEPLPVEPKPDAMRSVMAILILLAVTVAVGWAAASWGPALLAGLTNADNDDGLTVIKVPPPQVTIGPDQLRNLVGLYKASQIARRSIDSDLKVTLAEFDANGMVDAAATARLAISKQQDVIVASRERFTAVLNEIAGAYVEKPGEVEGLYADFLDLPAIRSDPEAERLLQMTAEAIKTSPPNLADLNEFFE